VNLVETLVRESLPLPDRRPIWDWAADNVDFGNSEAYKGPFNIENVPWMRDVMAAMQNPRVRKVTVVAPPQESGKTKAAETFVCSRIVNAPGKLAWNTVTNVKADKFSDTRFRQMRAACRALDKCYSENRHDKKKRLIIFRDNSWMLIQGAELDDNRQSDSVEVQVNDECQLWEQPWMTQMHARTRAFRGTEKIINLGLGGLVGSEWHTEFQAGSQKEWSHHCPHCDQLFQYRFNLKDPKGSNVHFDKTKVQVRTDGTLDFTDFRPTVYVTCTHCKGRIDYDEGLLRRLNLEAMRRGDGWVAMNPSAPPEIESFHLNAFAIGRRPWWQIVEPWIKATMGRSVFATSLLKQFITEELCEFWEEKPIVTRNKVELGDYTRLEIKTPGSWKDGWIRLMSFDNQEGGQGDTPHRWFVCREFSKDGRSRLVDAGRINEWDSCEKKRIELGVPSWSSDRPGPWTVVDRWHKPQEVDEMCARYKWFGIMGRDEEHFLHPKDSIYAGEKMLFSEERTINLSYGLATGDQQVACYYFYAKQKIETILAALRDGKAEAWEAPRDLDQFCPEYGTHLSSHHQVMESTKNGDRLMWRGISGAPDHLYDCECQLVVLALMAGVFRR
jgi:hypothetical protein